MDARDRRHFERGRRVVIHMDTPNEEFPDGSKGDVLTAEIRETLAGIAALDVALSAGASKRGQSTALRRKTRAELRRMVASTADKARAIALEHPQVEGIFTLDGKDGSDQTLIATARSFADEAPPLAALFTEYSLAPAFFVAMRSNADSLESSMALQNAGTGSRRQSRETLKEAFQRLNSLIERLDAVVRNKYREDPDRLAAWEAARRGENAPRSRPAENNNAPAPPPNN